MSDYTHKVVLEAAGPDGLYQRITFEQFYDESVEQVENQERLFTAVVGAVSSAAVAHRDENA